MNALMKFKSRICTAESYPYSIFIEYKLEIKTTDINEIFNEAYKFEEKMLKGTIVDETCEILGILQVREMKSWEALELANQGIQTITE